MAQFMTISLHAEKHGEKFFVDQKLVNVTKENGTYLSLQITRGGDSVYFHNLTLEVLQGLRDQLAAAVNAVPSNFKERRPTWKDPSGVEFLSHVGLPEEK